MSGTGADVGTSCSYQATFAGFKKAGFSDDEAESLFKRSLDLCTAARDEFWTSHRERVNLTARPSQSTRKKQRIRLQIEAESAISYCKLAKLCFIPLSVMRSTAEQRCQPVPLPSFVNAEGMLVAGPCKGGLFKRRKRQF